MFSALLLLLLLLLRRHHHARSLVDALSSVSLLQRCCAANNAATTLALSLLTLFEDIEQRGQPLLILQVLTHLQAVQPGQYSRGSTAGAVQSQTTWPGRQARQPSETAWPAQQAAARRTASCSSTS